MTIKHIFSKINITNSIIENVSDKKYFGYITLTNIDDTVNINNVKVELVNYSINDGNNTSTTSIIKTEYNYDTKVFDIYKVEGYEFDYDKVTSIRIKARIIHYGGYITESRSAYASIINKNEIYDISLTEFYLPDYTSVNNHFNGFSLDEYNNLFPSLFNINTRLCKIDVSQDYIEDISSNVTINIFKNNDTENGLLHHVSSNTYFYIEKVNTGSLDPITKNIVYEYYLSSTDNNNLTNIISYNQYDNLLFSNKPVRIQFDITVQNSYLPFDKSFNFFITPENFTTNLSIDNIYINESYVSSSLLNFEYKICNIDIQTNFNNDNYNSTLNYNEKIYHNVIFDNSNSDTFLPITSVKLYDDYPYLSEITSQTKFKLNQLFQLKKNGTTYYISLVNGIDIDYETLLNLGIRNYNMFFSITLKTFVNDPINIYSGFSTQPIKYFTTTKKLFLKDMNEINKISINPTPIIPEAGENITLSINNDGSLNETYFNQNKLVLNFQYNSTVSITDVSLVINDISSSKLKVRPTTNHDISFSDMSFSQIFELKYDTPTNSIFINPKSNYYFDYEILNQSSTPSNNNKVFELYLHSYYNRKFDDFNAGSFIIQNKNEITDLSILNNIFYELTNPFFIGIIDYSSDFKTIGENETNDLKASFSISNELLYIDLLGNNIMKNDVFDIIDYNTFKNLYNTYNSNNTPFLTIPGVSMPSSINDVINRNYNPCILIIKKDAPTINTTIYSSLQNIDLTINASNIHSTFQKNITITSTDLPLINTSTTAFNQDITINSNNDLYNFDKLDNSDFNALYEETSHSNKFIGIIDISLQTGEIISEFNKFNKLITINNTDPLYNSNIRYNDILSFDISKAPVDLSDTVLDSILVYANSNLFFDYEILSNIDVPIKIQYENTKYFAYFSFNIKVIDLDEFHSCSIINIVDDLQVENSNNNTIDNRPIVGDSQMKIAHIDFKSQFLNDSNRHSNKYTLPEYFNFEINNAVFTYYSNRNDNNYNNVSELFDISGHYSYSYDGTNTSYTQPFIIQKMKINHVINTLKSVVITIKVSNYRINDDIHFVQTEIPIDNLNKFTTITYSFDNPPVPENTDVDTSFVHFYYSTSLADDFSYNNKNDDGLSIIKAYLDGDNLISVKNNFYVKHNLNTDNITLYNKNILNYNDFVDGDYKNIKIRLETFNDISYIVIPSLDISDRQLVSNIELVNNDDRIGSRPGFVLGQIKITSDDNLYNSLQIVDFDENDGIEHYQYHNQTRQSLELVFNDFIDTTTDISTNIMPIIKVKDDKTILFVDVAPFNIRHVKLLPFKIYCKSSENIPFSKILYIQVFDYRNTCFFKSIITPTNNSSIDSTVTKKMRRARRLAYNRNLR